MKAVDLGFDINFIFPTFHKKSVGVVNKVKIPGTGARKLWKSGLCQGPSSKISGRGGGIFLFAVHGGSPDFYWNSPKV